VSTRLSPADVPQANNLERVRKVVAVIASGVSEARKISEATGISLRHVAYAVRAAETLGLLANDDELTDAGVALLGTEPESLKERAELRGAVLRSRVIRVLVPELLHANAPGRDELADRILREVEGLSRATAVRRAGTLLSWRAQLL
jgi:hypothetical protein